MTTTAQEHTARDTSPKTGGFGGAILRRLCSRLRCGSITIVMPDGARLDHKTGTPGPEATLIIHRWRMLRRLLLSGDVAFGESFIDGDWSSPDLAALIELAARNQSAIASTTDGRWLAQLINRMRHRLRANTIAGSKRNIMEHYDLGNEFYATWLDRTMSYSSALYRDTDMALEAAQIAKQDRIIDLLDIKPNHTVLEIGCGWGSLAARMAERGARVTGLTLSPSQRDFARRTLTERGLADRVDVQLQDYRKTESRFDRIVSIEMLEAVGEAYWPVYFDRVRDLLKAGGTAVLQVITLDHARLAGYRVRPDFIQRHIFPGGMLLSPEVMAEQSRRAGLVVTSVETFGQSYARTLGEWHKRFVAAWPAIAAQGFSPRFRKLWEYYLAYCEGGFRAGAIDVGLWRLQRPSGTYR